MSARRQRRTVGRARAIGGAALVLALALAAPMSSAAPPATLRFLGANPIGPLAEVRDGALATPARGACRAWGALGSRWRELDALGRPVAVAVVERREFYRPSGCDELSLRRTEGTPGAGVWVDAAAAYRAPAVAAWQPDANELRALEELTRARQQAIVELDAAHPVPFARRALFFAWTASGERYAVVGGRSLLVAALRGGRWQLVHEEKPKKLRARDDGYAPLAVTDMNGDGRPEVVVHAKEEYGEWYGDFTLSLDAGGAWTRIDAGIFGSTA